MGLLSFLSKLTSGNDEDDPLKNPQAQAQAPTPGQAPITVTGNTPVDHWAPHKAGWLGSLLDAIGSYTDGNDFHPFKDKNDERNLNEAMQGFSANPSQAIRRRGMIKGQEDAAWKMRNEEVDNTRQQGSLDRQNNVFDMKKQELVYNRVASMMGAARPDRPETWGAMRDQALRYGQTYGIDVSDLIPEKPDYNAIESIRAGAVPTKDQYKIDETKRYHQATENYRDRNLNERAGYHQGVLSQGQARIGVSEQNAATAGRNADTAAARASVYARQSQGRTVDSPMGPGVVDKTGNTLTVYHKDGKQFMYIKGKDGNHWKFSHQIIGTDEKALGLPADPEPDEVP